MIANCKSISHGKAAAEYDEQKHVNGEHIAKEVARQDVYGLDGSEIIKEMQEHQAHSSHKLKNAYFRIEIVPSKEERAEEWTDDQWRSVITDYCQRMGISDAQAFWVLHKRTDHDELPHVHGVVNRIDRKGKVLSDKFSQKRSIDVITKMTAERGQKTAVEVSQEERATIKEKAREALRGLKTYDFDSYRAACADLGLVVRPNISPSGKRSGYYLSLHGSSREFKASSIDRALTDSKISITHQTERKAYEREQQEQQQSRKWGGWKL